MPRRARNVPQVELFTRAAGAALSTARSLGVLPAPATPFTASDGATGLASIRYTSVGLASFGRLEKTSPQAYDNCNSDVADGSGKHPNACSQSKIVGTCQSKCQVSGSSGRGCGRAGGGRQGRKVACSLQVGRGAIGAVPVLGAGCWRCGWRGHVGTLWVLSIAGLGQGVLGGWAGRVTGLQANGVGVRGTSPMVHARSLPSQVRLPWRRGTSRYIMIHGPWYSPCGLCAQHSVQPAA